MSGAGIPGPARGHGEHHEEADVSEGDWYYDTETGQATQGKTDGWESRMGPYGSKAEAEAALERAKARNAEWDAQDDD